ncbi:MAG: tetratricopeptide repeat protein [Bacteroidota bacterium]
MGTKSAINCVMKLTINKLNFLRCFMFISLFGSFQASFNPVLGQNKTVDSLYTALKTNKADTSRINNLNLIAREFIDMGLFDSALHYANRSLFMCDQLLARNNSLLAAKLKKAVACSCIGNVYRNQSNYPLALEYYLKALKIDEELGDKKGIQKRIGVIGIIYWSEGDYIKALDFFNRSLSMAEQLGDKNGISRNLDRIGVVYDDLGQYHKALENYLKALELAEDLKDEVHISTLNSNIGATYKSLGEFSRALDYLHKSLGMDESLERKSGMAANLGNIGAVYVALKKYPEAEKYLWKALQLEKEIGDLNVEMQIEASLSDMYSATGRYQPALEHHKKATALKDSIFTQEKNEDMTRNEMNYEFEKKEALVKAGHEKEIAVGEAVKRKQKVVIWSVVSGLLVAMLLAGYVFYALQITRKQKITIEIKNKETEAQKKIIEEKSKDITDSINYAQRIQKALLASDSLLHKNLGEYFVLFKPKDIVSGDFYWATERNNRFYLAVCDSTGHGVPGAFMSLLNISFLNEAITEKGILEPNEVFNHVRQRLIENISSQGAKDGMDGILVCFDRGNKLISYASAHNVPYLMNESLEKLPGDNMPVGMGEKTESFTKQYVSFQTGNMLYLFTDGFADQFGGPKGKKFRTRQLEEKLAEVSKSPVERQKEILNTIFEAWKAEQEQVDDVLVVGICL